MPGTWYPENFRKKTVNYLNLKFTINIRVQFAETNREILVEFNPFHMKKGNIFLTVSQIIVSRIPL